jgi:hypothetical protein
MRRVSKKRERQLREYSTRRERYLAEHPVCEVWLREKGWHPSPRMPGYFVRSERVTDHFSGETLIDKFGAPRSTEIHHTNKRRGEMLNDERFWLAVCRENHERIEGNKAWARREGFLLDF